MHACAAIITACGLTDTRNVCIHPNAFINACMQEPRRASAAKRRPTCQCAKIYTRAVECMHLCRNYDDSKQLTEAKRDALFAAIGSDDKVGYTAQLISAAHISSLMLARNRTSLNVIAEDSTCAIIQDVLDAGVNIAEVHMHSIPCIIALWWYSGVSY